MPSEWFADEAAYLLFRLVNDVNLMILKNASTNRDLHAFAHCALDGMLRRIWRLNKLGVFVPVHSIPEGTALVGKKLCTKFWSLLQETEILASAIGEISETYLGGEDILLSDTRATLDTELSNLRTTADVYDPLTDWLDIEPLKLKELAPGSSIVDAKASQIVQISRAEALASCGDLRRFKDALKKAWPELGEGES